MQNHFENRAFLRAPSLPQNAEVPEIECSLYVKQKWKKNKKRKKNRKKQKKHTHILKNYHRHLKVFLSALIVFLLSVLFVLLAEAFHYYTLNELVFEGRFMTHFRLLQGKHEIIQETHKFKWNKEVKLINNKYNIDFLLEKWEYSPPFTIINVNIIRAIFPIVRYIYRIYNTSTVATEI